MPANKKGKMDVVIGILLLLLCLFVFLKSRAFPPRALYFVELLTFLLLLLTSVYLIQSFVKIKKGSSGKQAQNTEVPDIQYRPVVIAVGAFAVYVFALIPIIGFMAASAVTLFLLMYFLGIRSVPLLTGVTVGLPLVLFLLFQLILKIPLPAGLIFE